MFILKWVFLNGTLAFFITYFANSKVYKGWVFGIFVIFGLFIIFFRFLLALIFYFKYYCYTRKKMNKFVNS